MTEDTIAVAIRVRPVIKREKKLQSTHDWKISENEIYLVDPSSTIPAREVFTFDYILDQTSTNTQLYELVHPLVLSTLQGYNATVFAYGQTSSGKTHSILGDESDPGIIPLAANDIFACIREKTKDTANKYTVRLSYVEIYNEKINDLLDLTNKDIKIREDQSGNIFIQCHETVVVNEAMMMEAINRGSKNRQIGETKMNERSSRSHVICDITIESSERHEDMDEVDLELYAVRVAHLYIVDLAGSERVSQTGATGQRLNEGVHINKSLSSLINVITQLSNGNGYISFRDSKLTRLLTNSLGGNCRTLIVATITPVSIDDSLSTLKFARSAKLIKNKPKVNDVNTSESYIGRYYALEKKMRMIEAEKNGAIEMLENKEDEIKKLKEQIIPFTNMFVMANENQQKPIKSRRRHTLGSLQADNKAMETISEQVEMNESDNPVKKRLESVAEPCDQITLNIEDNGYQDLRRKYEELDQSHAALKEFTKLEMEVEVEGRTAVLQQEICKLKKLLSESEKYATELETLRQTYNILDVSHANLREFTQVEMNIAVEEKTRHLQEEIDKLKKRNITLEEIDVVSQSQQQQHQRRCAELLSRIKELEDEKERAQNANKSSSNVDQVIAKRDFTIKLSETQSRLFLDENIPSQSNKSSLQRSLSESNLLSLSTNNLDPTKREEFQNIYKSLRQLTSTIISDSDKNVKFRRTQRLSIPSENENAMLKETTNELLAKLKALTDKYNASQLQFDQKIIQYEEQIKELQEKLSNETNLEEEEVKDHSVNLNKSQEDNDFKSQIEILQNKCKEFERISKDLNEANLKIEELTNELQQRKTKSDSLPNQNSQFITELQEKLTICNASIKEKEEQIKDAEEIIKLKDSEFEDLQEKFKQKIHEHEMDLASLDYNTTELDEAMSKIKELQTALEQEKTEHLVKVQELLDFKNKAGEVLDVRIDKLEKDLQQAQETLRSKDINLVELEEKLKLYEMQNCNATEQEQAKCRIEELEKELQARQEKLKAKEQLFIELEANFKAIEKQHRSDADTLLQQTHNLDDMVRQVEKLDVKLNKEAARAAKELNDTKAALQTKQDLIFELEQKLLVSETVVNGKEQLAKQLSEATNQLNLQIQQFEENSKKDIATITELNKMIEDKNQLIHELTQNSKSDTVTTIEQEMQAKLDNLIETLDKKEVELKELENLQKINEEKHKCLDEKSTQLEELTTKISDLEKQIENNKQNLHQYNEEIQELNGTLLKKDDLIQELEAKLNDNLSKVSKTEELLAQINELNIQVQETNKLQELCQQKETLVKDLEQKLEETSKALNTNKEHSQQLEKQLQNNQLKLENLQEKYSKEKLVWEEKESKLLDNSQAAKTLEALKEKDVELQRINENLKETEYKHKMNQEILTQTIAEYEDAVHQVNLLKEQIKEKDTQHEQEIAKLNQQLAAVKGQSVDKNLQTEDEEDPELENLHQAITKLTIELAQEKGQHASLLEAYKSVKSEHNAAILEINQLQNDLKQNTIEIEKLSQDKQKEQKQSHEHQDEQTKIIKEAHDQLESEFERATKEIIKLTDEIQLNKQHIAKLEETLNQKQQEVKEEKTEMNELKASQVQLQEQLKAAQKNIKRLEIQLERETTDKLMSDEAYTALNKNYKYALEEIQDLKQELSQLTQQPVDAELKQQLKLVDKILDTNKDQLQLLQDELQAEKTKHQATLASLAELQQKHKTAESQIEELQSEIIRNKSEISKLYDDLNKSAEEIAKEKKTFNQKIILASQVIDSKEFLIQSLQNDLKEEKEKLQLINFERDELKEKLKHANTRFEEVSLKLIVANEQIDRIETPTTSNYTSNDTERKVKELETKLQHKHNEHSIDRENLNSLNKKYTETMNQLIHTQDELKTMHVEYESQLASLSKDSSRLQQKLVYIKELEATFTELKKKHSQDSEALIKVSGEYKDAVHKIQQLEASVAKYKAFEYKFETLQNKYDQMILNNKNALGVDLPLVNELRSEIELLQSKHSKETEKYDHMKRKYDNIKVEFEQMIKSKENHIKELHNKVLCLRKENEKYLNEQSTGDNDRESLRHLLCKSKLTIADLRTQLTGFKLQNNHDLTMADKDRQRLIQTHTAETQKLNEKLKQLEEQVKYDGDMMSKKRQKMSMQIDTELAAVPKKLLLIEKLAAIKTEGSLCLKCDAINNSLKLLYENCKKLPEWDQFQVSGDKETIKTELFKVLVETNDMLMDLLSTSKISREPVREKLKYYNKLIEEYTRRLKVKTDLLSQIQNELQSCKSEFKDFLVVSSCKNCELFKTCSIILLTLWDRFRHSFTILDGIRNGLEPLEFSVTNVKKCDEKINELITKVSELTSSTLRHQAEIEAMMQKYRRVKRLAEMRYEDVQLMSQVLYKENYSINFKVNPIEIVKNVRFSENASCPTFGDDDNPRPIVERSRECGRKSLGATPKHFSPFFITPDETKEAKHEARRHK